jgi:hypothetical protein
VRLHVFLVEDFAHRALHQVGEALMSFRRPLLAGMGGKKPRRPQFVRIAEVLGLAAGEINQPGLGLDRDGGLAASPRAIIERRHWAFGHGALNAALNRLVMQSERLAHGKKNEGSSRYASNIRARSTRLAGSVRDCAIDINFAVSASVSDNSIARRYAAISCNPSLKAPTAYMESEKADESPPYDKFLGIDRLGPASIIGARSIGCRAQVASADEFVAGLIPLVRAIQNTGASSLEAITCALNERGVRPARGTRWYASSVANLLSRAH